MIIKEAQGLVKFTIVSCRLSAIHAYGKIETIKLARWRSGNAEYVPAHLSDLSELYVRDPEIERLF